MAMHIPQGLTFPVPSTFPIGAEARGKLFARVKLRYFSSISFSKRLLFPIKNPLMKGVRGWISTGFSSSSLAFPTVVVKTSTLSQYCSNGALSNTLVPKLKNNRDWTCCVSVGHSEEECTYSFYGETQFLEAAQKGNLVPLFKTVAISSDQFTPMMAYGCLVKSSEPNSHSFLFDNTKEEKSSNQGRFSSFGTQPAIEIVVKENNLVFLNHEAGLREERVVIDPMNEPGRITSSWQPVPVNGLPDTFCGGWVGHFSYDEMRNEENSEDVPDATATGLPGIHLGYYKDVIVFDHASKLMYVIHWVLLDQFENLEDAYNDGTFKLNILENQLSKVERLCG